MHAGESQQQMAKEKYDLITYMNTKVCPNEHAFNSFGNLDSLMVRE